MSDGSIIIDTSLDQSGIEKGLKSLGNVASKGLSGVTKAITAVSTAIGGIATAAIKVGSDFEAQMSKVGAISGASAEDMKALETKAKDMGATTKFSATEAGQAMEYMAMAGWKTEDMLNGVQGIMNLAAASGENLATTSDIVTDALTAFGMSAQDSTHFADILASASSNANTNVTMLGESFKYVAPLCGSMGYSAEDASVALGLMANAGIKSSQAGTSLKTALTNMLKPTDTMAAVMEKYDLSLTNADGSMKSLQEVMIMLREKMGGLDEATQGAAAAALFGKESLAGMLSIINASDADFNKLTEAINNCDGSAEKMAETMQDNLQGQVTILKSGLEGLGISIYEGLENPLKEAVGLATQYISQLSGALKSGGFDGFVNELGTVLGDVITKISEQAPKFIEIGIQVINSFIEGIKSNLETISNAAIEIITSLVNATITLLPELISLGIELFNNLLAGIVQALPQIIPTIQTAIMTLVNTIIENLPTIIESGIQILLAVINGITTMLPNLIPTIVNAVILITETLLDNIDMLIDAGIQLIFALADGLINALPTLIEKVPQIINEFWDAFDRNLFKIVEAGIKLIVKLGEGIIQNIPVIIANAGEIVKAIFNTIMHLDLLSAGKTLISNLGTGLRSMGSSIATAAKEIFNKLLHPFESTTTFREIGHNLLMGLRDGIVGAVGSVIDSARNAVGKVVDGIKNFLGIHSPSKLMQEEVGKFMAKGVSLGFKLETDDMSKDMSKSLQKSIDSIDIDLYKKLNNIDISNLVSRMEAAVNHEISSTGNTITEKTIYNNRTSSVTNNSNNTNNLNLTIDKFQNNRKQDVKAFAEELEFYRKQLARGVGRE